MLNNSRYEQVIYPEYINTNQKVYSNLTYTKPEQYNHVSRYSITRRILDSNNIEYHETPNLRVIPEQSSDTYFRVDNISLNRLDIVAYKCYGFSTYWWVIAMANDIQDPFKLPLDTILRIPQLSSLYADGSVLDVNAI